MPKRLLAASRTAVLTMFARLSAPRIASLSASLSASTSVLLIAACATTPAEPVSFKPVPPERIVKQGYTDPAAGLIAVDVRRERSRDLVVRFRDALVYVDGVQVTDLMNGEHVVFYLSPGIHRLAVSTQFDPVIQLNFTVTADPRYTNHASVTFNDDHRIELHRVAQ